MTTPQIQETGFDGVITEVAFGLLARKEDDCYPVGTAVTIAPHLAVTARHVVDELWRHFGDEYKLKFGRLDASFSLIAQQVQPNKLGAMWAVRKLWLSSHTDLAVLFLEPFSDSAKQYRWRKPMLRLSPPKVDDEVSCFGYRRGTAQATAEDNEIRILWNCSPSTAMGRVTEVHHAERDSGMLKFPCFRTNAPFTHGMSGGPIFVNGLLSGIVCAGGLEEVEGQKRCYGASLWPLLATTLELDVEGFSPNTSFTILDLIKRGFIGAVDLEAIRTRELEDGRVEIQFPTD